MVNPSSEPTGEFSSLKGQFLIATPSLIDPNFRESVCLICSHDLEGAMGVVINRPTEISCKEVFEDLELETSASPIAEKPVLSGGPVEIERGFILHGKNCGDWESSLAVNDHVDMTVSMDVLAALAKGEGPEPALLVLGYAGWGPGQLESELKENSWLTVPGSPDILFSCSAEERYQQALQRVGFSLDHFSPSAGNA